MKYETPELTALTPAINAIQATKIVGKPPDYLNSEEFTELQGAYEDWE